MLKTVLANGWPYLLLAAIIALGALPTCMHHRDVARKGENARVRFSFGRNTFRKAPEQPYTEDRKINRRWKP